MDYLGKQVHKYTSRHGSLMYHVYLFTCVPKSLLLTIQEPGDSLAPEIGIPQPGEKAALGMFGDQRANQRKVE